MALRGMWGFFLGGSADLCELLEGRAVERLLRASGKLNFVCRVPIVSTQGGD